MTSVDLVAVFGLLEPTPPKPPDPVVHKCYTLDSFTVAIHTETAVLTCRCCRSKPYWLAVEDLSRLHPTCGLFACAICLNELRNAHTPSDHIAVWFAQNRPFITKDQHLYLPKLSTRLLDTEENVIMRPKRFVYSKFFDVALATKDKILNTCGDANCVNPYHMMLCASSATKLTPDMKQDVESWLLNQTSPQVIRQLLEIKYNRSLSLRTITNLKKSMLV